MISIKCANCGMVHNLTENKVIGRGFDFYCPNCREKLPNDLIQVILQYSEFHARETKWGIYILPSPEELRKLQL